MIKQDDSESHGILFQELAWELLKHKPWHQVHRKAHRALAKAGKHESSEQRLKVAQIFTTQSPIQNLDRHYCTFPSVLCEVFLNGAVNTGGLMMPLRLIV